MDNLIGAFGVFWFLFLFIMAILWFVFPLAVMVYLSKMTNHLYYMRYQITGKRPD